MGSGTIQYEPTGKSTQEVVVAGWFHETHDGPRRDFACIEHNHFGFALPREGIETLASKLASLLECGHCADTPDSSLYVNWTAGAKGWVMIAFRPDHHSEGRFYDISNAAARILLQKLRHLLADK